MKCEFCGSNIPEGATSCPACGAVCSLSQSDTAQQTTADVSHICVFCGNVITDTNDEFCPKCLLDVKCQICEKKIEKPSAVCPNCECETEVYDTLSEYLKPQRLIEKSETYGKITFYLIGGIFFLAMIAGGFFGARMDWKSWEFWRTMIVISSICVISFYSFPAVCKMLIKKLFASDPEYQSHLQMLKEDESFFMSKLQEYIAETIAENEE